MKDIFIYGCCSAIKYTCPTYGDLLQDNGHNVSLLACNGFTVLNALADFNSPIHLYKNIVVNLGGTEILKHSGDYYFRWAVPFAGYFDNSFFRTYVLSKMKNILESNDSYYILDKNEFQTLYEQLATQLKRLGKKVILLGIGNPNKNELLNKDAFLYNAVIKSIAQIYGFSFVDVWDLASEEFNHFTENSHIQIYQKLLEVLQ